MRQRSAFDRLVHPQSAPLGTQAAAGGHSHLLHNRIAIQNTKVISQSNLPFCARCWTHKDCVSWRTWPRPAGWSVSEQAHQ
ncbi:MAG: hypothetical protein SNJ52_00940, partial [Verrucomicrobiia bacterium]